MKYCIFHIPYKLDNEAKSAPMLRPKKMIQAFQEIGYCVDVVEGKARERAVQIKKIKQKVRKGVKYDFVYSEASTMPTILTETHHFPTHPFLDFSFFHFLKKNDIKIGLFYRDIYWKFDSYKEKLPAWKAFFAILCYKYDLIMYEKLLDRFYLSCLTALNFLHSDKLSRVTSLLPPGCDNIYVKNSDKEERDFTENPLHIFYVGGLGNQYQIARLIEAVRNVSECELTICCREKEWEIEKENLGKYISSNIHIVHKKNDELALFYEKADICSLMFEPGIYINMAMPYKSFEYLAHIKPVLVTEGTAIGKFVKKNNIGWSIGYTVEEIRNVLSEIISNPIILNEKIENCKKAKKNNTWEQRAYQVSCDLMEK